MLTKVKKSYLNCYHIHSKILLFNSQIGLGGEMPKHCLVLIELSNISRKMVCQWLLLQTPRQNTYMQKFLIIKVFSCWLPISRRMTDQIFTLKSKLYVAAQISF